MWTGLARNLLHFTVSHNTTLSVPEMDLLLTAINWLLHQHANGRHKLCLEEDMHQYVNTGDGTA